MRISDWSSDVCSSDLVVAGRHVDVVVRVGRDRRGGVGDHRFGAVVERLRERFHVVVEDVVEGAEGLVAGGFRQQHVIRGEVVAQAARQAAAVDPDATVARLHVETAETTGRERAVRIRGAGGEVAKGAAERAVVPAGRSEELRGGKEVVRMCSYRV